MAGALTRLKRQAIEERKRQRRRAAATYALLKLRRRVRPVTDGEVRKARQAGRP